MLGPAATSPAALTVPNPTTPAISVPETRTPEISTPEESTPPVSVPPVTVPPVSVPPVNVPPVHVPTPPSVPEAPAGLLPSVPSNGGATSTGTASSSFGAPANSPGGSTSGHTTEPNARANGRSRRDPRLNDGKSRFPNAPGGAAAIAGRGRAGAVGASSAHRSAAVAAHTPRTAHKRGTSPIRTLERLIAAIPTAVWIAVGVLASLALALAGASWAAAKRARRTERQRAELANDVGALQAALLPDVPTHFGDIRASVAYLPAEGPAAGGDFYDVFERQDGRIVMIVGDVSGHGRGALPHTSLIRYTLRAYLDAGITPRAALHAAGAALDHQLEGSYATVVAALYDPRERVLAYACAGHPPPLVVGTARPQPVLECCSPPIGTHSVTGLRETTVRVPGAARVCLFTDGVIEARIDADLFGVERLGLAVSALPPEGAAEVLLDCVVAATDRHPDDMAACVLEIPGSESAPLLCTEELEFVGELAEWEGPEKLLAAYGFESAERGDTLTRLRAAAKQDGRVVLRLHLDSARPEAEIATRTERSEEDPLAAADHWGLAEVGEP